MLKTIAIAFGVVFVLVGILGFIPAVSPDGRLIGLFAVNALHNWVHLATGIVALVVALSAPGGIRTFFRVFGVIYAVVAVLGFVSGDQPLLGLIANNQADAVLHVVIAAVALYVGFGMKSDSTVAA